MPNSVDPKKNGADPADFRAEYIAPFAEAAAGVLEKLFHSVPVRGKLELRPQLFTTEQVNIVFGLTGDVEGLVLFGLANRTALTMASHICKHKIVMFDNETASTLAEMGSYITSASSLMLKRSQITCNLTPPTLIRGSRVRISTLDMPALVVPFLVPEIGTIEMNISLKVRQERKTAA